MRASHIFFPARTESIFPVLVFAGVISLLLSVWLNTTETVINPDGVCYVVAAQTFSYLSLPDIMHLCPQSQWPFYSALIYGVATVFHCSYVIAANALNTLFSLISVLTFVLIIKQLGGTKRVLWFAALTILLAHDFNSVRENIIRDHGFWAFYLLSLLFLLHYVRSYRFRNALIFNLSLIIATLFRIEGIIFLVFLPFIILLDSSHRFSKRCKYFLILFSPMLFLILIVILNLLFNPHFSFEKLGRVSEIYAQLQHGTFWVFSRFETMRTTLAQHLLTSDSADEAGVVLIITMLVWYLIKVMQSLSWIYSALVIFTWRQVNQQFSPSAKLVLGGYLIINFILTFVFLAERLFLSKRYLIALALILMLWVPFALNTLIRKKSPLNLRIRGLIIVLLIVLASLGGFLDFGYSKKYIQDAGSWIEKNISIDTPLYSNDLQLMYYSNHYGDKIFKNFSQFYLIKDFAQNHWKNYDYLALRITKKDSLELHPLLAELPSPIVEFKNNRGDRVGIYRNVRHP